MVEEGGKGLLQFQRKSFLVFGQIFPGLSSRVSGRQLGVFRNNAQFQLIFVPFLADLIPAGVKPAFVFFKVFARCLVGSVSRAKRDIQKKRRPVEPISDHG